MIRLRPPPDRGSAHWEKTSERREAKRARVKRKRHIPVFQRFEAVKRRGRIGELEELTFIDLRFSRVKAQVTDVKGTGTL